MLKLTAISQAYMTDDIKVLARSFLDKNGNPATRKWKYADESSRTSLLDAVDHQVDRLHEIIYWVLHDLHDFPHCKNCSIRLSSKSFINIKSGYREVCSIKCGKLLPERQAKTKRVIFERYGVAHHSMLHEVQAKGQATRIERYGEDPTRYGSEGFKKRMIERYGVENAFAAVEVQHKIKKTLVEKYGADNPLKISSIRDKVEATNFIRYDSPFPLGSKAVQATIRATMIERYGVENPQQVPTIREKTNQTCRILYGGNSPASDPNVMIKMYRTMQQLRKHVLPSGRVIELMGYEPFVVDRLLSTGQYREDELKFEKEVPLLSTAHSTYNTYTADIYVPDENLLIDVKSTFFYELALKDLRGPKAAKAAGYRFAYVIWRSPDSPLEWDFYEVNDNKL
jgi:hypothetical protein